ncbi:MAG TPA: hypothetical protein VGQ71_10340 [Terriglobales bacterium]|nr:hypothetical protein [Terriglobales bacterium]
MSNLLGARRKLTILIAFLALLDVAALLFLLTPLGSSPSTRQAEYEAVRRELQSKMREAASRRGLDKKLVLAQEQIATFYRERFPSGYSQISAELGKLAGDSGVRISQGSYETLPAELPGLERVRVEAALDGEYVEIVKFVNALERSKMFFIVESVTLGQEQGGRVRLQLRLESYRKAT